MVVVRTSAGGSQGPWLAAHDPHVEVKVRLGSVPLPRTHLCFNDGKEETSNNTANVVSCLPGIIHTKQDQTTSNIMIILLLLYIIFVHRIVTGVVHNGRR